MPEFRMAKEFDCEREGVDVRRGEILGEMWKHLEQKRKGQI